METAAVQDLLERVRNGVKEQKETAHYTTEAACLLQRDYKLHIS
jgi:hypothetical protein